MMVFVGSGIPVHADVLPVISEQHVDGEAIVKFKEDRIDIDQVGGKNAVSSFADKQDVNNDEIIAPENLAVVSSKSGESTEQLIDRLSADSRVEYVEPNYTRKIFTDARTVPDDTNFTSEWGLDNSGQTVNGTTGVANADINAPEAWNIFTGNQNTIVAILDTGADITHPDLVGNLWDGSGGCVDNTGVTIVGGCPHHGWDFVNDDNDPTDDHGHGTHVAGIIGAKGNNAAGVTGVNWNVSLMIVKVGDADGYLSTANWIKGLNFAKENGAKIVNASFGGPDPSQAEYDALANFSGLFVAAAGNSHQNVDNPSTPNYPSGYAVTSSVGVGLSTIETVTATNSSDALASFSNYGVTSIDVAAPGVDIYSTVPPSLFTGTSYAYFGGTSMATPMTAGLAALLLGRYPSATTAQLKGIIERTGDSLPALSGKTVTGKRINAFSALSAFNLVPTLTGATIIDDGIAGRGLAQVHFIIQDNVGGVPVTLKQFEYSVDGGVTFVAPTNTDTSAAFSASWSNNNYLTSLNSAPTPTEYSFTVNLNHADLANVITPLPVDIRVRFKLNNTLADSDFVTSQNISYSTATLSGAPTGYVSSTTATITVGGTGVVSYAAKLDSGALSSYVDVATPLVYSGLTNGAHAISVYGKDAQGNVQIVPTTTATWHVDIIGPTGTITVTTSTPMITKTPTFALTLADSGVGVTGATILLSCDDITYSDPLDYSDAVSSFDVESGANGCTASDGTKTVYVKFKDSLNNLSTAVHTNEFIVHAAPVVAAITSKPDSGSSSTVSFQLASDFTSAYKYRLDSSSADAFSDERLIGAILTVNNLTVGSHTIDFIAKNSIDGSYQSIDTPTSYTWTVAAPVSAPVVSSGGGGGGGGGGGSSSSMSVATASSVAAALGTILGYSVTSLPDGLILKPIGRGFYYLITGHARRPIPYPTYRKKYFKTSRATEVAEALLKNVPQFRVK